MGRTDALGMAARSTLVAVRIATTGSWWGQAEVGKAIPNVVGTDTMAVTEVAETDWSGNQTVAAARKKAGCTAARAVAELAAEQTLPMNCRSWQDQRTGPE